MVIALKVTGTWSASSMIATKTMKMNNRRIVVSRCIICSQLNEADSGKSRAQLLVFFNLASMFSPFDLPIGILLLVTDQLSSPADFFVHRTFLEHLKGVTTAQPKKAILLSVSEDIARWKAIAAKSNLNLDQQIASGSLVVIDVLSSVRPPDSDVLPTGQPPPLLPILNSVLTSMGSVGGSDLLVIVDDLATLDWLGFTVLDITRFVRALYAACRKINATLIVRQHVLTPSGPEPLLDDLFRSMFQLCSYHLEVLPLSSGKSGSVSGQVRSPRVRLFSYDNDRGKVALHAGPGTSSPGVKLLSRNSALQYKLTDNNASFFERGTSAGVL
ncbi:unnamed protein product [Mycena citricolor]|uniref:Elongator complex protein 5 n=1 Tax=Mycena citricolor TaxID=2018698 RepID=A0AAD2H1R7_9AGAR|nr:unnamed protein product [Mycena citricolor]